MRDVRRIHNGSLIALKKFLSAGGALRVGSHSLSELERGFSFTVDQPQDPRRLPAPFRAPHEIDDLEILQAVVCEVLYDMLYKGLKAGLVNVGVVGEVIHPIGSTASDQHAFLVKHLESCYRYRKLTELIEADDKDRIREDCLPWVEKLDGILRRICESENGKSLDDALQGFWDGISDVFTLARKLLLTMALRGDGLYICNSAREFDDIWMDSGSKDVSVVEFCTMFGVIRQWEDDLIVVVKAEVA